MNQILNDEPVKNNIILVVDDDENLRKSISRILKNEGYKILLAGCGEEAQGVLGTEKVDLVISDVRMPRQHGIELFHYVKRTFPNIPFILMTGYTDTIEITEAYELGVKEFLSKPFGRDTIISIVKRVLNNEPDENIEVKLNDSDILTTQNYFSLTIDIFYTETLDYSIYLKLSPKKTIKLVESGTELTTDRIATYQGKGVKELYIKKADFIDYINKQTEMISGDFIKKNTLNEEEKNKTITKINSHLFDLGFQNILSEEIFNNISNNLNACIEVSLNNKQTLELIDTLIDKFPLNFAHSYGVAFLSIAVAKESKIKSLQNIFTLAIAGLLHDIGLKAMPDNILNKERIYFNDEEENIYQTHPTLGQNIVNEIPACPEIIGQIILEHHEYVDGSGFPKGLRGDDILPLSKLITIASDALALYKSNCDKKKEINLNSIVTTLEKNADKYDAAYLKSLKKIFTNTHS